eukprot:scaffold53834_cov32-Tisochrysis_lutea.AAC.3
MFPTVLAKKTSPSGQSGRRHNSESSGTVIASASTPIAAPVRTSASSPIRRRRRARSASGASNKSRSARKITVAAVRMATARCSSERSHAAVARAAAMAPYVLGSVREP